MAKLTQEQTAKKRVREKQEEEEEQNENGGSDEDFHQSPLMEGCGDSSDGEGSGLELQIISSF